MMDGRIGAIRKALEASGPPERADHGLRGQVCLGLLRPVPRRGRLRPRRSTGDKRTYQMDPANSDEALREVGLDIAEGADMVMVKPGMPYLDIVRRVKDDVRRADLRLPGVGRVRDADGGAAQNGWLDGDKVMLESLLAFKRAGADGILTYFAPMAARMLNDA